MTSTLPTAQAEGRRGHGSQMHVQRSDLRVVLVLAAAMCVAERQEREAGDGCTLIGPALQHLTLHRGAPAEGFAAAVAGEGDSIPDRARLAAIAAEHGIGIDVVRLGVVVCALVRELAGHLDRGSRGSPDPRQRALVLRIRAFIDSRLGDPDLTPASIAAAHHISVRYLHKLFRAEHATVADHVRRTRLERCRRDLLDPTLAERPVSAIARRWGFGNAAHFSRAFRDVYGLPPGEYRTARG